MAETFSKVVGDRGEALAADYLENDGYKIIDRNVRYTFGEIDIVARKGKSLHFVEVRCRRKGSMMSPLETITPQKIRKIKNAATAYSQGTRFRELRLDGCHCHFDVISIEFDAQTHNIEHICDAFE